MPLLTATKRTLKALRTSNEIKTIFSDFLALGTGIPVNVLPPIPPSFPRQVRHKRLLTIFSE